MSKVIGVTGESGSGKSELCRYLKAYGCAIIDCDKIAREVTKRGSRCLEGLKTEFGSGILTADGRLIRKKLAAAAFASPERTARLNALTHPYILEKIETLLADAAAKGKIAVIDAPLLSSGGLDKKCDVIALLTAPQQTRLARIMRRDGIDEHSALARLGARREPELDGNVMKYENDGDTVSLARFAQMVYNTVK